MRLGYAFVANAAEVGQDGRFFVLGGGIDGIEVPAVPAVMPALAIVVNISFEPEECGEVHRFRMTLTGPDGNDAGPQGQVDLRPRQSEPAYRNGTTLSVAVSMIGLPLGHQGEYAFNLFVGDRLIGRISFWVFIAPSPAGA
jgi:hypothetical protein